MKQLLFVLCTLLSGLAGAQTLPACILDLQNAQPGTKTDLPFSAVKVLDVRFDRSNIGSIDKINKANISRVRFKQHAVSFPDSLHRYFPQVVQKIFTLKASSKDTLVLLVKQFRLSERLVNNFNLQYEPELMLRLSLSAFRLKEGQLSRLFSLDDLYSKKLPTDRIPKEKVMNEYRRDGLVLLLQEVLQNRHWTPATTTAFSLPIVEQGLHKRYQLPLFSDTTSQSGIYQSFQEFKQNAPSITNVQIRMNKNKVVSIKDSTGKTLDPKTFWGVCNGKDFFISFRGDLCKLVPSDKSFYFLSYIRPGDLSGLPSFGDYAPNMGLLAAAFQKSIDNRNIPHFFFLNIDEETIYLEEVFGRSSLKQLQKELLK